MRITFVMPRPNLTGGMRVILRHAEGLRDAGHDVHLVLSGPPARGMKTRVKDFVQGRKPAAMPLEFFEKPGIGLTMLESDRPAVAGDLPDADVVIATWWRTAAPVAALPSEKGVKVYYVQDYGAANSPLEALAETWRMGMSVITLCPWMADLVRAHASPPAVDVVLNGIDADRFAASVGVGARDRQARPIVGMQGRASAEKGADIAAEAARLAAQVVPDLSVISFGFGALPDGLSLPEGSVHHRAPPDDHVPALYASCDAWLFPSRREGFGLPILEAMAVGTPVIATPAAAAPVLVNADNGVLLDSFEPEEMAEAILRLLRLSTSEWRAMSAGAAATARRFPWAEATAQFEAALERAVARDDERAA